MVLAEASAYSKAYHCDAVATQASAVSAVPRHAFRAALEGDPALAQVWVRHLAQGVQAARFRAELRTLPRVVDRLQAWLAEGNSLPEKADGRMWPPSLGSRERRFTVNYPAAVDSILCMCAPRPARTL